MPAGDPTLVRAEPCRYHCGSSAKVVPDAKPSPSDG